MSKSNKSYSPVFIDVMDPTRTVEPCGRPSQGKVACRVYFEGVGGKPEYVGKTLIPTKLFDDRTVDEHKLTHSQFVGFILKVDEKPNT